MVLFMFMLWVKAFHIIAMVTWFAGLFYVPRLFVYHAACTQSSECARFKIMERRLYFGITTPGAVVTLALGFWLLQAQWHYYLHAPWMLIKLGLVALLLVFHLYCGRLYWLFKHDKNPHSATFYRWINEIPTVLLIGIICLVVVKPF